ncbi:MAG TPA: helix-turn-helix domain-containing protein [Pirellulales bacterium]|nr:helix-turn-helix domain-containing protein [Pirellulales bacterium]
MATQYAFAPDYVSIPGSTLKETLDARGLSQADLALRTGMAEKTISQIINGRAPISHDTANKLELVLGIPARFWNHRELSYREGLIRMEEARTLDSTVEWLEEIPVKTLVDRGFVKRADSKAGLAREVLRFFGVSDVAAFKATWMTPEVPFRGKVAHERHPGHVAAWLRMGELVATAVECRPYDPTAFRKALDDIRTLTMKLAGVWREAMKRSCAEAGVAVVFVKDIPNAGVSGCAKWLTKDKALIQLSLKFKTDDQLWFTFFHEACHILKHSRKGIFLEDGEKQDNDQEREADEFSNLLLVPAIHEGKFPYLKGRPSIRAFAQTIGVAPGIVVGRLQRAGVMPYSCCNDLKRKLKWMTETAE